MHYCKVFFESMVSDLESQIKKNSEELRKYPDGKIHRDYCRSGCERNRIFLTSKQKNGRITRKAINNQPDLLLKALRREYLSAQNNVLTRDVELLQALASKFTDTLPISYIEEMPKRFHTLPSELVRLFATAEPSAILTDEHVNVDLQSLTMLASNWVPAKKKSQINAKATIPAIANENSKSESNDELNINSSVDSNEKSNSNPMNDSQGNLPSEMQCELQCELQANSQRETLGKVQDDSQCEILGKVLDDSQCGFQGKVLDDLQETLHLKFYIEDEYDAWEYAKYEKSTYMLEHLTQPTNKGENVRSKSEALIANKLLELVVPYRYEQVLHIGLEEFAPDFTVRCRRTGKTFYWEHFGLITNKKYMDKHWWKLQLYANAGIKPWDNLIVTYDDVNGSLNLPFVEAIIKSRLM